MIETFKERLAEYNVNLELVVNENQSTMLNLLEGGRRLSVHKMFLDAPDTVISAIAHYVRGTRRGWREKSRILRRYIQENHSRFDTSHTLKKDRLVHQGEVYDLKVLYEEINDLYFGGHLDLHFTWYGRASQKRRARITYGMFLEGVRLVKMHRLLDHSFFPEYFVSFVLYHEMLHSVVPGHIDSAGRYCTHGPSFKTREREFRYYREAVAWEKKHKKQIFEGNYGWS